MGLSLDRNDDATMGLLESHYPRLELDNSKIAEMDQTTGRGALRQMANRGVVLWLLAFAAMVIPLILLTLALDDDPSPSQDQRVLDWVTSHGFWGLGGISDAISALTDAPTAAGMGSP